MIWRGPGTEFLREESATADALWYCDLTTGPDGQDFNVDERLAEIRRAMGRRTLSPTSLTRARPGARRWLGRSHWSSLMAVSPDVGLGRASKPWSMRSRIDGWMAQLIELDPVPPTARRWTRRWW